MQSKRIFVPTDLTVPPQTHEHVATQLAEKLGLTLEAFYIETGLEKTILHMSEIETGDPLKIQNLSTSVTQEFHHKLEGRYQSIKDKSPNLFKSTVRFGNKGNMTEEEVNRNKDDIEFIVLGRKERSAITEFFSGTLTQKLTGSVGRPVLIVPDDAPKESLQFKKVLYATSMDEETPSYEAKIKELVKKLDAQLQLIHVNEYEADNTHLLGRYNTYYGMGNIDYTNFASIQQELDEVTKTRLKEHTTEFGNSCHVKEPVFRTGNASQEILKHMESESADLIVLGAHRHSAVAKLFLGSLAEKVIARAKCSVMVFPH